MAPVQQWLIMRPDCSKINELNAQWKPCWVVMAIPQSWKQHSGIELNTFSVIAVFAIRLWVHNLYSEEQTWNDIHTQIAASISTERLKTHDTSKSWWQIMCWCNRYSKHFGRSLITFEANISVSNPDGFCVTAFGKSTLSSKWSVFLKQKSHFRSLIYCDEFIPTKA